MNSQKVHKQLIVVCGVIEKDGKILMTLRHEPETPNAHNKWEFPGGKIDSHETPEQALRREVMEETGTTVEIVKLLPYVHTAFWEYEWGTKQAICLLYYCKYIDRVQVTQDHRITDIKWFGLAEIKDLDTLPGTNQIIEVLKKELA